MEHRAYKTGERSEFKNGYKYGNLNLASEIKICFTAGFLGCNFKEIFPKETAYIESYLNIDASDCSDEDIHISLTIIPITEDAEELREAKKMISLGQFSRAETKEIFIKAVANL